MLSALGIQTQTGVDMQVYCPVTWYALCSQVSADGGTGVEVDSATSHFLGGQQWNASQVRPRFFSVGEPKSF